MDFYAPPPTHTHTHTHNNKNKVVSVKPGTLILLKMSKYIINSHGNMSVTVIIAVTQLIRGVINAVTSTADAVMTGLAFQREFIESGRMLELGRISKRSS